MSTSGYIRQTSCAFEWQIRFSHLSGMESKCFLSPRFEFASSEWYLRIRYDVYQNSYSNVNLYLVKGNSRCSKHVVSFKLSIKDKDNKDIYCTNNYEEFVGNKIQSQSCLYVDRNKLSEAPKGFLTAACTVIWERCNAEVAEQTVVSEIFPEAIQQQNGVLEVAQQMTGSSSDTVCEKSKILWEALIRNLKDMFLNQKKCDVTLRVQGQEFSAHKIILEARSTVFAAMFEHDMAENRSGVVEITDTEPDMFRNILLYMYSGEVEEFSTENVFEFYALAEKYNLEDLKQECVKFIESNLTVDTICEVLILVDKYDQKQMKEFSTAFLRKNMADVLATEKWKKFESENLLLVVEVLKSLFVTVRET